MCKGIKDLWTKATKRGVSSCLSGKTMHTLGPCLWKSSLRDSCPLQNASQSTLACCRSNLASGGTAVVAARADPGEGVAKSVTSFSNPKETSQ
jgi:hypothetical protein